MTRCSGFADQRSRDGEYGWSGNKKKDRGIGTTKVNKREAEEIARRINKALALGTFESDKKAVEPIPFDREIRVGNRKKGASGIRVG